MLDTLTAMHRRSPHQLSSDTAGYYREVDQRLSEVMAESHTAIETLLRWYRQGADISSPPYVGQVAQRHTRGWKLATQPCRPPTFNNVEGTHWQGTFDFADGEWLTVSGFGGVEGPFPKQGIHATVRWTTEAKAILRLYSSRSGPRRLAFEFTTLVRGQTVEISAEGEVLAQEVLSGGLKTVNRIVVEGDLGQGWCHIAIKVDRMRKTPDGRTVGVMIRSIELENAEKPITRAVDRTKQAIRPLGDP